MNGATKTVSVIQGDYAVSADPAVMMSTVLGSCIAVCLYDPVKGIGGMNHFLLAVAQDAQTRDLKYGINAMELLINRMLRAGAVRDNLQAKLFGGARMTNHAKDIGKGNAKFAEDFLQKEGINCVSASLGGEKARRIQFIPTTGAARQMQITGPAPSERVPTPVAARATDITLF